MCIRDSHNGVRLLQHKAARRQPLGQVGRPVVGIDLPLKRLLEGREIGQLFVDGGVGRSLIQIAVEHKTHARRGPHVAHQARQHLAAHAGIFDLAPLLAVVEG